MWRRIWASSVGPSVDVGGIVNLALLRCHPPGNDTSRCWHISACAHRRWHFSIGAYCRLRSHCCGGWWRASATAACGPKTSAARGDEADSECVEVIAVAKKTGNVTRSPPRGRCSFSSATSTSSSVVVSAVVLLAMTLAVGVGRRDGCKARLSNPGHQCRRRPAHVRDQCRRSGGDGDSGH
jgi:hypothetical protein